MMGHPVIAPRRAIVHQHPLGQAKLLKNGGQLASCTVSYGLVGTGFQPHQEAGMVIQSPSKGGNSRLPAAQSSL